MCFWHGQGYLRLYLSLSISLFSNLRFSLLASQGGSFFFHTVAVFFVLERKGPRISGRSPKEIVSDRWSRGGHRKRAWFCDEENVSGSWKFSFERFPPETCFPGTWSICECRWHRLDAVIVLRPEILVCRHSSWYRFVSHCIRASSWILRIIKGKKNLRHFFKANNCQCTRLLPDSNTFFRVSHSATLESGRRWFWREKLPGDYLRRIPERCAQCLAICDFLVNKNGTAAQHARVT